VAFICDFLVLPASDGRYSTDHQEVLPKWNHRDGWKTADHHHKVQRGDRHRDAGRGGTITPISADKIYAKPSAAVALLDVGDFATNSEQREVGRIFVGIPGREAVTKQQVENVRERVAFW
jgi:hypothetical protein